MGLIELAKDIYELAEKANNLPLLEKIMELREQIQELREKNVALAEENSELKKKYQTQNELVFDGTTYWKTTEGEEDDGPYCQLCWDKGDRLIRLQPNGENTYFCNSCEKSYDKAEEQ